MHSYLIFRCIDFQCLLIGLIDFIRLETLRLASFADCTNAHRAGFSSPANSFLQCDVAGHHVWLNAPLLSSTCLLSTTLNAKLLLLSQLVLKCLPGRESDASFWVVSSCSGHMPRDPSSSLLLRWATALGGSLVQRPGTLRYGTILLLHQCASALCLMRDSLRS